jgi:ATP-binding cassette, subfamily B, bacterial
MSFFAGLAEEGYDRQYSDRELMLRMAAYFQPHLQMLLIAVFMLLVISLSGAAVPLLVSRGVDMLTVELTAANMLLLATLVLLFGVVVWGANWLRRRLLVRIIGNIIWKLRLDAFGATAEHDLSFYDLHSSGKVVSRITSDSQEFGQTVILVTDLISQFVQSLLLAIILVLIDWKLSLLLFSFIPVIFFTALGFRRIARTVTRRGMRAMAQVNATIKEMVSGIAVAKNFRQEKTVFVEFDNANQQSYQVNVQRGLVLSTVFPTLNVMGGVGTAVLVYVGGLSVAQGLVTVGAWFLFLQTLERFFFPVLNLSAFWAQVQSGLSAAERVFALIDAEPDVNQIDKREAKSLRGEIQFENVCFSYTDQEIVLKNFNLKIHPGENIALVGHTGAGKSSIAKLIARFYEYQDGCIYIDDQDIRAFDLSSYRKKLGIVSQTPFLFSGTVAENICYACASNDPVRIESLAYQIGNGEWLDSLPHGLETEVGERGSRLSMGQRQLVSLMRVLVQKPVIFILDEATASVDPFTEWQIQQALNLILADTTSILIAHRLSTIQSADRIIVLDRGQIIEEGNHDGLLAQGGHYASLYNTYFRHQSLDYRPPGLEEHLTSKMDAQPGD